MYICKVINKVAEKRLVPKDSGSETTGLSFEEYERIANESPVVSDPESLGTSLFSATLLITLQIYIRAYPS